MSDLTLIRECFGTRNSNINTSLLGSNRKQRHIVLVKYYLSMQFFFLITEAFSGISSCLKQLWFSSKEKQSLRNVQE